MYFLPWGKKKNHNLQSYKLDSCQNNLTFQNVLNAKIRMPQQRSCNFGL